MQKAFILKTQVPGLVVTMVCGDSFAVLGICLSRGFSLFYRGSLAHMRGARNPTCNALPYGLPSVHRVIRPSGHPSIGSSVHRVIRPSGHLSIRSSIEALRIEMVERTVFVQMLGCSDDRMKVGRPHAKGIHSRSSSAWPCGHHGLWRLFDSSRHLPAGRIFATLPRFARNAFRHDGACAGRLGKHTRQR